MSLIDLASLVLAPTATKEGKVYSAIPDTGEGDMTFTRGSSATRVNSAGLIEKERANLLLQSNTFNTTWTTTFASITSGQSGYDGSSDAWKLQNTSGGVGRVIQSLSTSGVQTFSIYAKGGNVDWMALYLAVAPTPYVYYDITNGVLGTSVGGNDIDAKIEAAGNGYYRCTITYIGSPTEIRVFIGASDGTLSINSGDNILIQDAMLNEGLVAQPYIETTTTAVYEGITDDVPRVDYSGGGCPSLLLEPSRTQLLPHSEYFEGYSVNNGTATANQIISPEGVLNAYQFTENTGTSAHYIDTTSISVTSGNSYVISLFAKYDGRFLTIQGSSSIISSNYATFNLQTGVVEQENIGDASIEDYGNGWYRCIFKITATGTGSGAITILLNDSATGGRSRSYTGDGESGIYIYGFQVEAGNYSTSYIPTYGTSTTRVADVCSKTGISELIGQTEGTIFMDFVLDSVDGGNDFRLDVTEGTSFDNEIFIGMTNGDLRALIRVSASNVYDSGNISATVGTRYKMAMAYANNDVALYINGTQEDTSSSATIPNTDEITIGNRTDSKAMVVKESLNQAMLFPTRLTNDQLEELTK